MGKQLSRQESEISYTASQKWLKTLCYRIPISLTSKERTHTLKGPEKTHFFPTLAIHNVRTKLTGPPPYVPPPAIRKVVRAVERVPAAAAAEGGPAGSLEPWVGGGPAVVAGKHVQPSLDGHSSL